MKLNHYHQCTYNSKFYNKSPWEIYNEQIIARNKCCSHHAEALLDYKTEHIVQEEMLVHQKLVDRKRAHIDELISGELYGAIADNQA